MSIDRKIAVIGAGNLGGALLAGLLASKACESAALTAADVSAERLDQLRTLGVGRVTHDNRAAVEGADVVVLAVKPDQIGDVLDGVADALAPEQLLISMAAAVPIAKIESHLEGDQPILRAMPNLAMTVFASATALTANAAAGEDDWRVGEAIFASVGRVVRVAEKDMHVVTGLSGSGPAYVFTLIESLAAGGVKMGLRPAQAQLLAAQTLYGAAKLALEGGAHPAELRDRVTTPGGTTIFGLQEIELGGVRGALAAAVEAATERSIELAQILSEDD